MCKSCEKRRLALEILCNLCYNRLVVHFKIEYETIVVTVLPKKGVF